MKIHTKKQKSIIGIFLLIALFALSLFSGNVPVKASAPAEVGALTSCASYSGHTAVDARRRATCRKGYVGGYDGKQKASICKGLTGSTSRACSEGFDKGKSAKANVPKDAGTVGAKTKLSKTAICNKYHNADDKKACQTAYDKQNITMATAAGKAASDAGACDKLGYGGAKEKTACKKAFTTAQTSAGSGKNKCNDVHTYFNFDAICQGTDNKASDASNPIIALALGILNFFAFGVALAVAGGIIYGGILYTTARDSSAQTQKAIGIITDSVIGLVAFFFMWTIINFIVPGGLF